MNLPNLHTLPHGNIMALINSVGARLDPVMGYNFTINLIDSSSSLTPSAQAFKSMLVDTVLGGFTECTGLEMTLDLEEYHEGGNNSGPLKFPTGIKWSNIVLKHGIGVSSELWDWHYSFVLGKGKRKDGVITILNDMHLPAHIWYFKRALPVKYSGPALNASESKVAIEALEISHEGLYKVPHTGAVSDGVSSALNAGLSGGLL